MSNLLTTNKWIKRLPINGKASDVGGIPSATSIKKTVVDNSEVIPKILKLILIR